MALIAISGTRSDRVDSAMQNSQDGAIVGQKGVRYGLQIRNPGPKPQQAKPKAGSTNVFGEDSDEDDVGQQVMRQADKKRAAAKVQAQYEAALAQDASVFDYDGVYDSMQQQKVQPRQQEKLERKSRYIAQLKDQAEERKKESDIAYERKTLKVRHGMQSHGELFVQLTSFTGSQEGGPSLLRQGGVCDWRLSKEARGAETVARERKAKASARSDAGGLHAGYMLLVQVPGDQLLLTLLTTDNFSCREEEEQKHDVRKVGHMGNFYANLLNKNVAFGGSAAADPKKNDVSSSEGPSGGGPSEALSEAELTAIAAKAGVHLDKYDLLRLEAERALKSGRGQKAVAATEAAKEDKGMEPPGPDAGDGEVPAEWPAAPHSAEAAATLAAKRRNDDTAVMSAKERYLARKKQNVG